MIENDISETIISVEVKVGSSVQDILNKIYFQIQGSVKIWTYLVEWVVIDINKGTKIIIREVSGDIPAYFIFKPDAILKVILLKRAYSGEDSADIYESSDLIVS